ncbi:hypothetical protein A9Z42_0062920 [Trichoderma parareesei]|uniref:Uncharacterized protein n=1 Tax=Trichoderma parareesei TaxID=858221 RepID=A0A2H2ZYG6_TRIPA|nr:hypothetical protein A9Z42_0062920 [Trichoderma parareesei]
MPALQTISPYIPLHKARILLSGLPNVYLCGTPSYGRMDNRRETVRQWMCIPRRLERTGFVAGATPLTDAKWNIEHLLDPYSNMPLFCAIKRGIIASA